MVQMVHMSDFTSVWIELFFAGCLAGIVFRLSSYPIKVSMDNSLVTWVEDLSGHAGMNYSRESLRTLVLLGLGVSVVLGLAISPVMAVLVPVMSAAGVIIYLVVRARQLLQQQQRINDEICYSIARKLRAGQPLENCVALACEQFPTSVMMKTISTYTHAGLSLQRAISTTLSDENLAHSSHENMLAASMSLAHVMGGNSARIFERMGDVFHQSYELSADTTSSLAQVRLSAFIIGLLPLALLTFSFVLGSTTTRFLLTQPLGWACLVSGSMLEFFGVVWMKKLVHSGVGLWVS